MMVLMVCAMIVLPCIAANALSFKEGKWSMSITTKFDPNSSEAKEMQKAMKEMENMPPAARAMMEKMQGGMGVKMGAGPQGGMTTTITQCLSDKDPVPDMEASNKDCQQTHEIKGNTVTFKSVCKVKGTETTTTGNMTYKGDSMKGEVKSRAVSRGKTMDTTMEMTGKYLGPCK
jgi:hypothetical protein